MAKQATRQVSIFLNGKQVENSIKAIAAEQRKVNNELAGMIRGTEEYEAKAAELRKLNGILADHRKGLNGIQQGWSLTRAGLDKFVGVAAGAFAVDSIIGYGKQLFNTGAQMEAMAKKARTVFGEALPQVTAEADKNARAMGLTNAQYVVAAANIQDLLVPMGFQRKEAGDISTQLVNLSGALAEWSGGTRSATEVAEILQKALLGEREALEGLGIGIREADVQAQLAAKGLDKLTGASLEQAKAAATLELILNKSRDAQAQFAAESDSAVRRQAELSAKISEIAEKLSTLLLPVFESLVSIASSVVDVFGDITAGVESVIDPAGAATKAFDEQAKTVSDLETDIVPLLDRYDELAGKTNLNAAEQDELQKIITEVSGVIPTAIKGFDEYGRALGLNTAAAREFIKTEQARLKVTNAARIEEFSKLANETEKKLQITLEKLRSGRAAVTRQSTTGFGAVTEFENLSGSEIQQLQAEAAQLQETLKGANAEVARLKGDNLQTPEIKPPDTGGDGGAGAGDGKDTLKAAQKLQDDLTKLIERTTELRLDLISKAQDDELAATIRGIEKRYDAEIAKALELEKKGVEEATAQRIALEALKQEEIGLAVEADIRKAIEANEKLAKEEAERIAKVKQDAFEKDNEERAKREEQRLEAEAELKAFADEALLSEQELELANLETHFNSLLDLARTYGFDVTAITEAYVKRKNEIIAQGSEEERQLLEAQTELQLARFQALQQGANALSGLFEENSTLGKALFLFQKGLAAAEIIINLQTEIAKINATYASIPFAGPAIAATLTAAAKVRAGVGLGAIAATAIKPFVKQKYEGRYLDVTGQQDGRSYRAKSIAPPDTGLLPNFPVLFTSSATGAPVLASERGQEYFVSAPDLANPAVANYVRMIDNIVSSNTGGRVPQFADGGSTSPLEGGRGVNPLDAGRGAEMRLIEQNTAVMQALLSALQRGIIAVIPDGTVIDINERFGKINKASGGYYG